MTKGFLISLPCCHHRFRAESFTCIESHFRSHFERYPASRLAFPWREPNTDCREPPKSVPMLEKWIIGRSSSFLLRPLFTPFVLHSTHSPSLLSPVSLPLPFPHQFFSSIATQGGAQGEINTLNPYKGSVFFAKDQTPSTSPFSLQHQRSHASRGA